MEGRRVVVGVSGGIAAFKAVLLVRELQRRGARVRVVMTRTATRFVGPATFAGITGRPAVSELFDTSHTGEIHVELGAWAEAMVVAPATMNLLARAAQGMADDAVLATLACTDAPLLVAPAMHTRMWERPATQRNLERLRADGVRVVEPVVGPLASGDVGSGRMAEPEAIADALGQTLRPADLAGLHVLVSAGPTVEDLDPVRFLGNRSTGRMGYAIAEAARDRGAVVTLVTGPTALAPPRGVRSVAVRSALDMEGAMQAAFPSADVVIMAAAVADYRPAAPSAQKLKKTDGPLTLKLVRNPDILAALSSARSGPRPILVGFALETENVVENARVKLARKGVDLVVANHARDGFGGDSNLVSLVSPDAVDELPRMSKRAVADRILDRARALLDG